MNLKLRQLCLFSVLFFTYTSLYSQINPYQRLTDPLAITYIDSLYPQKFSSGIGYGATAQDNGSGVITHLWCTFDWFNPQLAGIITIRIDDKVVISEPFHSFFRNKHGLLREPLNTTMSGGFVCDVQMPYRKNFQITIRPDSSRCCVFYGIGWRPLPLQDIPESFGINLNSEFSQQQQEAEEIVTTNIPPIPQPLTTLTQAMHLQPKSEGNIFAVNDQGVVRKLNFKPDTYSQNILDSLFLEIYWDNSPSSSVNVPFSDFFVVTNPFSPVNSFYIKSDSANGLTSYFPMPFFTSARIRVVNKSSQTIQINSSLEYSQENVDREKNGYFFANFKIMRSIENLHLSIARIRGQGKYISTVMNIRDSLDHTGYMEGDAKFTIDSSAENYIQYTGTEDYFNGGWYFIEGAFSRSFAGAPKPNATMYRIHCLDAIDFKKSLDLKWEHGSKNNYPALYRIAYTYYKKWKQFWVDRDTIRQGETWTLAGSGYKPLETVNGFLDSNLIFTTLALADGTFKIPIQVPFELHSGEKKLLINSDEYDEFITVIEKPTVQMVRDSLPDIFQYSDSVLIVGHGFAPDQSYSIFLDSTIVDTVITSSVNTFQKYIAIPHLPDGKYPVLIKNNNTLVAASRDSLAITRNLSYEFEALKVSEITKGAYNSRTNLLYWGYDHWSQQSGYFYSALDTGGTISFEFSVPMADIYKISLFLTMGSRYGQYDISVDNQKVSYFDGYLNKEFGHPLRSPELFISDSLYLSKDLHTITFKSVGKNPNGSEYSILTDNLILKPITAFKKPEVAILPDTLRAGLIYPNPFSRNTDKNITFVLPDDACKETAQCLYNISCSDILGKVIFKTIAEVSSGKLTLPIMNLPAGMYFCTLLNQTTGVAVTYSVIITD